MGCALVGWLGLGLGLGLLDEEDVGTFFPMTPRQAIDGIADIVCGMLDWLFVCRRTSSLRLPSRDLELFGGRGIAASL